MHIAYFGVKTFVFGHIGKIAWDEFGKINEDSTTDHSFDSDLITLSTFQTALMLSGFKLGCSLFLSLSGLARNNAVLGGSEI